MSFTQMIDLRWIDELFDLFVQAVLRWAENIIQNQIDARKDIRLRHGYRPKEIKQDKIVLMNQRHFDRTRFVLKNNYKFKLGELRQ